MLGLLMSCTKNANSITLSQTHSNDTVPSQYGVPFNGVPDPQDATIYQVNIRAFSSKHNFQGVIDRLDNIKALGINVIYLMPIYPVGELKSVNSPYCIKDYKAVNPEFGTLSDFRNLVDGAHARGMSVLLDWVGNHTSWDNAWIVNNRNWYVQDNNGNIVSPIGWADVAQLNFKNLEMRLAMIKSMKYWILTANIDGFRCDYADGPPVDFWKQAIDTMRNISAHKLLLFAEGNRSSNYSAGFDYNFGFVFYRQLKKIYGNSQPVSLLDSLNMSEYVNASGGKQIIRYLTNHDVNSSDGTPLDLFGGKKGSMSAFIVVAYMKSVPMIYNGQEVGMPIKLTFPFTSTTINWTINPDVTAEYTKIIAFRNKSEAIRRGSLTSFSSNDVCVFTKTSGIETVLVISNFRNAIVNYMIPDALKNTTWEDAFNENILELNNELSLSPFSYFILKKH
jgi:glycosidase